MAVSVDQFGKSLVASDLMSGDEVKSFWNALTAEMRPKTGDAFAQLLVDRGKLTAFQAKEILEGRGARLVMGDYVILQEIGAGGMGQVYRARHRRMERTVALKVMSAAAMKDEAAVKRFQREVRAAAKLEHPNIVTAYDSGEAGSVKYLVMQFVDGGDLASLIKHNGPLAIDRAVDYVIQAARGLAYAHGEGVIHRDIKPANLLLDKKGVVKILDMGLARIESGDDGLTATEQVMGTVDYMSPEQAANTKGADARADVYSLGCTLWFLLTGKKVYEADTMIARLMAHRDGSLPSLMKVRDDAPWPLEQAFHKMIAKRADDRFQTMDDVIMALAPFGSTGAAPTGAGSSIGLSAGPQDAELASFLKSVGPGAKSQLKAPASKTHVDVDGTAQFTTAGTDTDPKSEMSPVGVNRAAQRSATGAKPQAKGQRGSDGPPLKLIAGGISGVALLLCLGVWLIVRNKGDDEIVQVAASQGESTPIVTAAPAVPTAGSMKSPATTPYDVLTSPDFVWSEPVPLSSAVNSSNDDQNPFLSADGLTVYFNSNRATGSGKHDLWLCRRATPESPWSAAEKIEVPGLADDLRAPTLSTDELTMFYQSSGNIGGYDLMTTTRSAKDAPWSEPTTLSTLLNSTALEESPELSRDGLTLFYQSNSPGTLGDADLWQSTRRSTKDGFTFTKHLDPPINSVAAESGPCLSSDGRVLLFQSPGPLGKNLWMATRTTPAALWTGRVNLGIPMNGSATLSVDARTLIFSRNSGSNHDLWESRRVLKGSAPVSAPSFLTPMPTVPVVPPPPGDYAVLFDGDGIVKFDERLDYDPTSFTIEALVRPTAHAKDASVYNISEMGRVGLNYEDGAKWQIDHYMSGGGHFQAVSKSPIELNRRVHFAGVFDRTEFRWDPLESTCRHASLSIL